jgi:hypothetical protein
MSDAGGGRRGVRRRVGEAVDTGVGLVGGAARGLTQDTVRQIIEDLTPHLIEETLPAILEAVLPRLIEEVAPAVVDGLTPHLVERTVPAVLSGTTPTLADDLLPEILRRLRPFLEQEYAPALIDAVTPQLLERTAPHLISGLLPTIRAEVVPVVLDDVVADPRLRNLVRQQSLGLVLDAQERFRRRLARGDDTVDRVVRRIVPLGRPRGLDRLAPAGRSTHYAGVVTRGVALVVDLGVLALLAGPGLSATLGLLDAVLSPAPGWVVAGATTTVGAAAPLYFALSWCLTGSTLGSFVAGFAICGRGGERPALWRSAARAWLGLLLLPVWAVGMACTPLTSRRTAWHDRLTGTEARYVVSVGVGQNETAPGRAV